MPKRAGGNAEHNSSRHLLKGSDDLIIIRPFFFVRLPEKSKILLLGILTKQNSDKQIFKQLAK